MSADFPKAQYYRCGGFPKYAGFWPLLYNENSGATINKGI